MSSIRQDVEGDAGYSTRLTLSDVELSTIREMVRSQWLEKINKNYPNLIKKFQSIEMDDYHLYSEEVDHQKMWPKTSRIIPDKQVKIIRSMPFVKTIEKEFGEFLISNEEGMEKEEIYWRLVRPGVSSDIGPLHSDAMFWSLGHGRTPESYERVKIWIALYCEKGISGFRFSPGSHAKKVEYTGEDKGGILKPKINDLILSKLKMAKFNADPGGAIIFHDDLVHGGLAGGEKTRVSIEFTIMHKKSFS